jgi:hypothetical protein
MSIVVKGTTGSDFTPHPEGQFPATCSDVQDLGWEEHPTYGWKYKIRLVFFCGLFTDEKEYEGEKKRFPMTVSKKFTATLAEKGNLRKFCRSWKGKDFTPEVVRDGFDFELMLGAKALIQVGHYEYQGSTYAGIDSVMKLPPGMTAPEVPADYVRMCEREGWTGPATHPSMSELDPSDTPPAMNEPDDDLPF